MIGYNEVKDLSEHEIVKLAINIVKEQEQIANTFNLLPFKCLPAKILALLPINSSLVIDC